MEPRKLAGMLGLARRAGALAVGRSACKQAALQGRVALLILARDAGPSAGRDAGADAARRTLRCDADKAELGRWVGRSSVAVVAVTDANLAAGIVAARAPAADEAAPGDPAERAAAEAGAPRTVRARRR
jgi:ribosomal protein L7Ae-like RNA K-turn-binding protein